MGDVSKLLTSIAALIGAMAWPAVMLMFILTFRRQFMAALDRMPAVIDRMEKVKLGILEAEMDKAANVNTPGINAVGTISAQTIQSAAAIKIEAKTLDIQVLRDQVQRLCIEYETTRNLLPPSYDRTRAMSHTLAKMRALALAISPLLDELKQSGSAGNRLAGIAIMQMSPDRADIAWLKDRFATETPFVFFQAAIALKKVVERNIEPQSSLAQVAAAEALKIVSVFDGIPDDNTVELLRALAQ